MTDRERVDTIDLVARRAEFLDLLFEPLWKRDIVDRLEASRSTANRAIKQLEEAGLVERTDEGYVTTSVGRLALERHRAYCEEAADLADATEILTALPPDCDLDIAAVAGSECLVASTPAPYRPAKAIHEAILAADEYRAVLPGLGDDRHIRLLYEHVVTDGGTADLVVSPDLLDTLRTEFVQRFATMVETGRLQVRVGDVPPYALVRTAADGDSTMGLVVFTESGAVKGVLQNTTSSAVAWADEQLAESWDDATDVTSSFRHADGASVTASVSVPPILDAQGFLHLTPTLFAERATADPLTAWRTGLDLTEVQTGYAIDRTSEVDDERRSLTAELEARLRAGTDCLLLGPPGCGKSTTCKQVACQWYRADRGPVFYRPGSRGRRFDAVDELVAAANSAAGQTLIVVEDAVRADARAIFDALRELDDRDDVSFLLDARESEWLDSTNRVRESISSDALSTVTMPPLLGRDCDTLIEHIEETVGATVDVPLADLREEVRGDPLTEGATPGDVLLFVHRAIRYLDPLVDESTSLESDTRTVYETLRDEGEGLLDVGVLLNLLNAVGIPVDTGVAQVLETATDEDIARALDRLDGHVLFTHAESDVTPRTTHEAWSTVFLDHVRTAEPEGAARIQRCLAAYLSLADDAETRAAVRRAGQETTVDAIEADPTTWADDRINQVFSFVETNHPKFAPVLGAVDQDGSPFPNACSARRRLQAVLKRGQAYRDSGDLDTAERDFRAVLETIRDATAMSETEALTLTAAARRGLGKVAHKRGQYDEATDLQETALDTFRELEADEEVAATYAALSATASDQGDHAALEAYATAGLELAERLDDSQLLATHRNHLGIAKWGTGELAAAAEHFEASIEHASAAGDRRARAFAYSHLGLIERERGSFERAVEYFRRGIQHYREMGIRRDEALDLWNLAEVSRRRGDLEAADEYLEQALDRYREIDAVIGVARTHVVQGEVALDRGDLAAAEQYGRDALEVLREHDELLDRAGAHLLLAGVYRSRGNLDAAERQLDQAQELCETTDSTLGDVWGTTERGRIEREREHYNSARRYFEQALELARTNGYRHEEAKLLEALGEVALDQGRIDDARERFRAAFECHDACGAPHNSLAVLQSLVDTCERAGDLAPAVDWCERGEAIASDATLPEKREEFATRRRALADELDASK